MYGLQKKYLWSFIISIIFLIIIAGSYFYFYYDRNYSRPIKVGVLFALTGTMAISEQSLNKSTLMAIDEINQKGGILGRLIQPIIIDSRSDLSYSAAMAKKLIQMDKVSVIFGCWTSACRKTLKPIVEKYNHLLIYPVQYEGLEESPNIIYTGAAPNQQIIPAIKWTFDNLGKRFFLIGSDYIFPRIANLIIKDQVHILGGEIVGEEYLILGSSDVKHVVDEIIKAQPTVIINTINGDSNIAFFKELRSKNITPQKIPTLSFSIAENELLSMDVNSMLGDYAAWNYFQSIQNKSNSNFVSNFKKRYGAHSVTDDPIEAAYFGVYIWAQAVEDAGKEQVALVKERIKKQSMNAPEGVIYIDSENQHTWKTVRIGKILADGQFEIVWHSEKPTQPIPYPTYRSKEEWDKIIHDLYKKWNNHWENSEITTDKANKL